MIDIDTITVDPFRYVGAYQSLQTHETLHDSCHMHLNCINRAAAITMRRQHCQPKQPIGFPNFIAVHGHYGINKRLLQNPPERRGHSKKQQQCRGSSHNPSNCLSPQNTDSISTDMLIHQGTTFRQAVKTGHPGCACSAQPAPHRPPLHRDTTQCCDAAMARDTLTLAY